MADHVSELDGIVAAIAHELLERVRKLNQRVTALEREIRRRVIRLVPSLEEIPGCGAPTAAKIVAETAGL